MDEEKKINICPQCQAENNEGSKFCTNCGTPLTTPIVSAEEAAPTQTTDFLEEVIPVETVTPVTPTSFIESADSTAPTFGDAIGTGTSAVSSVQPPPTAAQTPTAAYTAPVNPANGNIGIAIASMICGILSILCCCLSVISIFIGAVGIILGIITLVGNYDGKGMAIAGIITGAIGALMWIVILASGLFTEVLNSL